MKNILLLTMMIFTLASAFGQNQNTPTNTYNNSASNLLQRDGNLLFGGYGEVHYNQPVGNSTLNNGTLDVHRVVMLFGYNFTPRIQFVTEIEYEHVSEVYIEQAFMQYKINNFFNLRAGLMLTPMGIINEYHEPTTFNGVERPHIDKYISPTTWREIGFGATGNSFEHSFKYQLYVMNGFNGFDGSAKFNGKNGLRSGRQKGADSFMSSPNLAAKVEYYGIRGLNIGVSGYFGNSQTTLYEGVDRNDQKAISIADSSVVGIAMIGLDARYKSGGFQFRGQFYYNKLSNTHQYNYFTASADGTLNDLGSSMLAYYVEMGYDVFRSLETKMQLIPFVRYEWLDTQYSMAKINNLDIASNPANRQTIVTSGLTLLLSNGAVAKADIQFVKDAAKNEFTKTINFGIGVMF